MVSFVLSAILWGMLAARKLGDQSHSLEFNQKLLSFCGLQKDDLFNLKMIQQFCNFDIWRPFNETYLSLKDERTFEEVNKLNKKVIAILIDVT